MVVSRCCKGPAIREKVVRGVFLQVARLARLVPLHVIVCGWTFPKTKVPMTTVRRYGTGTITVPYGSGRNGAVPCGMVPYGIVPSNMSFDIKRMFFTNHRYFFSFNSWFCHVNETIYLTNHLHPQHQVLPHVI